MKSITLFLILVLSISVYAKTEADINLGLNLGLKTKQKRDLAAAGGAVDAVNAIAAFSSLNYQNSKGRVPVSPSFTNTNGALTPSNINSKSTKKNIIIK